MSPFPFVARMTSGQREAVLVIGFDDGLILAMVPFVDNNAWVKLTLVTLLPADVEIDASALPYDWPNPWMGS